jgi:menaquinone reductase, multiheme cytochrome c subunit
MSWCLSCHRAPEDGLRPLDQVTKMNWKMPEDHAEFAQQVIKDKNITPPTDCSGCHR